jgi:hypothetical protein
MRSCADVLVALFVGATIPAAAQPPELVTDRPDFTESPVVVPAGSLQLEGGATWLDASEGSELLSGPELLLRWGIAESVELRLVAPDRLWDRAADGIEGITDAAVGAKLRLAHGAAGWDAALIATAFLPTGDTGLTSDAVDPSVAVAVARDVSPRWALGGQVTAAWPTIDEDRRLAAGATVVIGAALGERVGTFVELAAERLDDEPTGLLLHHGYTFAITPTVQLDLHAAAGLNDAAPDLLLGAGFAFRW